MVSVNVDLSGGERLADAGNGCSYGYAFLYIFRYAGSGDRTKTIRSKR
jgi:hypothetical protein